MRDGNPKYCKLKSYTTGSFVEKEKERRSDKQYMGKPTRKRERDPIHLNVGTQGRKLLKCEINRKPSNRSAGH